MRKNNFFTRLKMAFMFLFIDVNKRHIRVMTCGKCGSISIKAIENTCEYGKSEEYDIDLYWEETSKCQKCGAECREVQMWKFEKAAETAETAEVANES